MLNALPSFVDTLPSPVSRLKASFKNDHKWNDKKEEEEEIRTWGEFAIVDFAIKMSKSSGGKERMKAFGNFALNLVTIKIKFLINWSNYAWHFSNLFLCL